MHHSGLRASWNGHLQDNSEQRHDLIEARRAGRGRDPTEFADAESDSKAPTSMPRDDPDLAAPVFDTIEYTRSRRAQCLEHLFAQPGADPDIRAGRNFLEQQFNLSEGEDLRAVGLSQNPERTMNAQLQPSGLGARRFIVQQHQRIRNRPRQR